MNRTENDEFLIASIPFFPFIFFSFANACTCTARDNFFTLFFVCFLVVSLSCRCEQKLTFSFFFFDLFRSNNTQKKFTWDSTFFCTFYDWPLNRATQNFFFFYFLLVINTWCEMKNSLLICLEFFIIIFFGYVGDFSIFNYIPSRYFWITNEIVLHWIIYSN